MKETCEKQENLDVKQLLIEDVQVEDGEVKGVVAETGEVYRCRAVILATGTYLRGRIIIGETTYDAGPNGQRAAMKLTGSLQRIGVSVTSHVTEHEDHIEVVVSIPTGINTSSIDREPAPEV